MLRRGRLSIATTRSPAARPAFARGESAATLLTRMLPSSNEACNPSTSAGPHNNKYGIRTSITANDAATRYIHHGARRDLIFSTGGGKVFWVWDAVGKAGLFRKPLASASAWLRRSSSTSRRKPWSPPQASARKAGRNSGSRASASWSNSLMRCQRSSTMRSFLR